MYIQATDDIWSPPSPIHINIPKQNSKAGDSINTYCVSLDLLHHRIDDHGATVIYQSEAWTNGRHFADGIVKSIFLYQNCYILIIKGPNNYKPALIQKMVWHNKGDKPSSETMMAKFTVAYMRHSESLTSSLRGDIMHTPILWVTRHTEPVTNEIIQYVYMKRNKRVLTQSCSYNTRWRHQMEKFSRSPVNSPHKGQWRGALMLSLICDWVNSWVNIPEACDLRRRCAHYDVSVMTHHYLYSTFHELCLQVMRCCVFFRLVNKHFYPYYWGLLHLGPGKSFYSIGKLWFAPVSKRQLWKIHYE